MATDTTKPSHRQRGTFQQFEIEVYNMLKAGKPGDSHTLISYLYKCCCFRVNNDSDTLLYLPLYIRYGV